VRNAIHAFHRRGVAAVQAQSRRPKRTRCVLAAAPLRALLHERPGAFGKPRSTWTLRLAAEVCWEQGPPPYPVSLETISHALDYQPRAPICVQEKPRDRLIRRAAQHADWGLGCTDETWWSRDVPRGSRRPKP
jgi:hypothetical protein